MRISSFDFEGKPMYRVFVVAVALKIKETNRDGMSATRICLAVSTEEVVGWLLSIVKL